MLSCFSCVQLCATPETAAHQAPPSWDSPGKNTGVGCHFLLRCMKVKSKSEVAQSCPTLSDPMDYSLPGSSVHGIFQTRVLESLDTVILNLAWIKSWTDWNEIIFLVIVRELSLQDKHSPPNLERQLKRESQLRSAYRATRQQSHEPVVALDGKLLDCELLDAECGGWSGEW